MAFGKQNNRKDRDGRQVGIKGMPHSGGVDPVEEPAVYHIFALHSHPAPDDRGTSEIGRKLIRRVRYGSAAKIDDEDNPPKLSGYDAKKVDFLGCGVRIYRHQYAFVSRTDRQIEIETLQVQSCVVTTFTNFTRRVVGLLRFDCSVADEHLLPAFVRAARNETRAGDRVRLEVHGGAFTDREARSATLVRRNEVMLALEGIIRDRSMNQAGFGGFTNCDLGLRWTADCDFNLRIQTWDGAVSIASSPTTTRKAV